MPTDLEALAHAVGVLHTDPHPLSIHNIATAIGTTALAWIAVTSAMLIAGGTPT